MVLANILIRPVTQIGRSLSAIGDGDGFCVSTPIINRSIKDERGPYEKRYTLVGQVKGRREGSSEACRVRHI